MNLGSALGFGGSGNFGSAGANYTASRAPNQQAVTTDQTGQAYNDTQTNLANNSAFANALAGLGGVGNQGNVFALMAALNNQFGGQNGVAGQTGALTAEQQLAQQLQGGAANQANVFAQQQGLTNQLQGVVNGTGPNPAAAALAQNTGANIAATGSLLAGQRGSNANVGLLGRNIALQGADTQQQAVGQGATLQAGQSLNALGQIQGQQANMANVAAGQVGQLQGQQGAIAGLTGQQVAQQVNQQAALGNLATTQVGQQANQLGNTAQLSEAEQQQLLNAIAQYNNSNVGMQSNVNNANATIANTVAQGQQGILGGILGGTGSALNLNKGGMVPGRPKIRRMAEGGYTNANGTVDVAKMSAPGPKSFVGKFLTGANDATSGFADMGLGQNTGAVALNQGANTFGNAIGTGISNLFASGPTAYNGPQGGTGMSGVAQTMTPGFSKGGWTDYRGGGKVPGKDKVNRNSVRNDTVKAKLSPKEIVLPLSVTMSNDPVGNSAKFVAAVLAKRGMRAA